MEESTRKVSGSSIVPDQSTRHETRAEKFFRKWAPPVVLTGVGLWALFAGGFLAYYSWNGGFIVRIVEEHFPGMILVPMAALMALCIVLLLRWTAGALEFELLGQAKLKGASGPLTLWLICFLAIIFAIWLLWPLQSGAVARPEAQQGHAGDARVKLKGSRPGPRP
jgi:hypothetical protein